MKEAVVQAIGATVVESVVAVQPSDDLSELIGKRIGNYVIDRPLGRGGMAVVLVAKHPTLGREVAVKFLKPAFHGDLEMAERFLQEAKVTATLAHPNIVEILDFGDFERRPYYMMELLQGEDLRARLRSNSRTPYREVVQYVEQICDALDAAHKVGVVHRDLKPDNIFVVQQDPLKLKVMDFGVAKAAGETRIGQTLHGQVLGTPTHMAPEQALGQIERISPLTDIYSLGVIAFEMLTGQLPFVAESALMVISMHIRDAVPSIRAIAPEVPRRIAELVESCLAKDPAQRPRSARVLATQLLTACKVAERSGAAAAAPQAKNPSHDAQVVEELAQRLAKQEKPTPNQAERFGIRLPGNVNFSFSDPPDAQAKAPPDVAPVDVATNVEPALQSVEPSLPAPAPEVKAPTVDREPVPGFKATAPNTDPLDAAMGFSSIPAPRSVVTPRGAGLKFTATTEALKPTPSAEGFEVNIDSLASKPANDGFAMPIATTTLRTSGVDATLTSAIGEARRVDATLTSVTGEARRANAGLPSVTGDARRADGSLLGAESEASPEQSEGGLVIPDVAPPSSKNAAKMAALALPVSDGPRVELPIGAAIFGLPGQTLVSENSPGAKRAHRTNVGLDVAVNVPKPEISEPAPGFGETDAAAEMAPMSLPAVLLSEITDDPAPTSVEFSQDDGAILERLLRRMQRRGDFPSFLSNLTEIVTKADADGQYSAGQLAEALRKDFGLTAKLLKVVNTAFMSRFKGRVYSVNQAVVILGFDSVRSIASSVLVYKVPGVGEAAGKHQTVEGKYNTRLAESAINSLVSGEIARLLTVQAKLRLDPEIAMMAATFRNLGQHLVMQYLPEEYEKIEDLMQSDGLTLAVASERVLGLPLRKLGCGVMQRWQLPTILCDAVTSQTRPGERLERDADRLGALSKFATDLCDLVARGGQAAWQPSVQKLLDRNRNLLVMDEQQVGGLISTISRAFEDRFAALLGPYCTKSRFLANAQQIASEVAPEADAPKSGLVQPIDSTKFDATVKQLEEDLQKRQDPDKLAHRALTIVAQLLRVPRVLLLALGADKRQMEVRAGVGPEVESLKQVFKPSVAQAGNVFSAALATNKPIVVEDALSSKNPKRAPQQYYEVIGSPCFALMSCTGVGYPGAILLVDVNASEHLPTEEAMLATRGLRNVIAQVAYRLG